MADLVVIILIVAIVGVAVLYIVREKKKGVKCVGCPYAMSCAQAQKGGCNTKQTDTEIK